MSKRRLTLVAPAILAAGLVAASLSFNSGRAENDCLSGPKGVAPEGSHWYYRVDRATGRHCWFLGAQGLKVRQAASSPTPVPTERPAAQPAEKSAAPPGEKAAETSANLPELVTLFSKHWPRLPEPADTAGRAPISTSNSYAEETESANEQDEMPLVWPVLTPAELAAAGLSRPPTVKAEHLLALLAAALALAGILTGLVYAISSVHFWRRGPDTSAVASKTARVQMQPFGSAGARHRQVGLVRKPAATARAPDLPREPREPRDPRRDFELALRELLEARRCPAA